MDEFDDKIKIGFLEEKQKSSFYKIATPDIALQELLFKIFLILYQGRGYKAQAAASSAVRVAFACLLRAVTL